MRFAGFAAIAEDEQHAGHPSRRHHGDPAIVATGIARPARAATKLRFLTSWFAQAEHGGFYQAKATGLYDKAGLLFAGVNADQCALCTLQDANFLGYDCVMLEDCCATTSPAYCWDATLYNVRQCFGFVTTGAAIVAHG